MHRSLRRSVAVLLILALLPISSLALAGCGDDTKTSKTEIALRLGLAYGAFKRYVYTPSQEGAFKAGAPKRKRSIAKAAVASAFTARMLQKALEEARQDPDFAALATKIAASAGSITALTAILRDGDIDLTDIAGGLGGLDGLLSSAKELGINVKEEDVSATDLLKP